MNNKTDKIKSIISEAKALDRFLLSRGVDPRFVTTDQKVSHAKSGEFQKWLRDRQFKEQDELEDELIEQKTSQEKFKSGLKKAGYDPDKGAKRLTDVIAKQKKEREEHEKKYGHLYAKEGTDYSLVKGQSNNQYKNDVKLSNGYVTKVAKQPKDDYDRKVDKYLKKKYNKEEVEIKEEHLVHVSDGSKYDNEPDAKDTEHVMAGIKKHGGTYDGASDKGAYFKFKSHDDAKNFKKHVDSCPNRSCHADLHEGMREESEIEENHIAIAMGKEMDDEGSMTLNQLDQMSRGIDMVRNYVGKDMKKQLPSWVQSKITLATDYIDTVGNYLSTTNEGVEEPTSELEEACWTGYTAVGTKMKNGKKVPNCVPTKESFEDEHGISDKKKQNSKSARIIKSIYKKKNMKEDIYDHEKDDKSTVVYGKKPKISNIDDKAGMGENKPEAAAVMSGGTTLTGQNRDVVEIDPMMRKRPGQPDPTKK